MAGRPRAAGCGRGHASGGGGAAALRTRRLAPAGGRARRRAHRPEAAARGRARGGGGRPAVVEGAGGLLSPLAEDYTVCDLAVSLALPLLIAARTGLGTINHSLLTLQAARGAGLQVRAVVLTPWPAEPSELERSNRDAIARMGQVEVVGLPFVEGPDPRALGRAGETLPWRGWLSPG